MTRTGLLTRLVSSVFVMTISMATAPRSSAQDGPCPSPPPGARMWSNPATWGGQRPKAGDDVVIPASDVVYMDVDPPALKSLQVLGTLLVGCKDIGLRCDKIEVWGEFLAGSPAQPFHHQLTITLGNRYHAPDDTSVKAFRVHPGGRIELCGLPRSHSWLKLGATASAEQSEIRLEEAVDWEIGEEIVIASTDFDMEQAEQRTITGIREGGLVLELDHPLHWTHWGEIESFVFDQRAEVALLDRNILVRGDKQSRDTSFGGHMMFMGDSDVAVQLAWVECQRMGQIGRLGRYPVHFHLTDDATGNAVRNCSVHHCYNRSITVHGTDNLLVEGNVSYDTVGHAFFLENSTEVGNRFLGNLGLSTRTPAPEHQITPSDEFPSTYWITNTDNEFIGNVAAGSEVYGFWYDVPPQLWADAVPPVFRDNCAHSNGKHGYYTDHRLRPTSVARYERFSAYKNREMGVWHRSYETAIWDGALLADNRTGFYLASEGLQRDGFSFIAVINSAVLGESGNLGNPTTQVEQDYGRTLPNPNNPTQTISGFEVYDGLVAVYDSIFAEYQPATIQGHTREAAALAPVFYDNPWAVDPRNHACNLAFLNAKVAYFKPPVATANGVASTMIYDCDGSLTGTPDQWIAAATELITPASGHIYDPDWNANIVPGFATGPDPQAFAQLTFWDLGHSALKRIRVDALDRLTGRDVYEPALGLARYPVSIIADERYAISFPTGPTRDFGLELRFSQPNRFALVRIDYASAPPATVWVDFVPVDEVDSLDELEQSGGGAYFYDDAAEMLYVLPVLGGTGSTPLDGTETTIVVAGS